MKRQLLAGSVFSLVLLCGAVLSACGGGGGGGSLSAPGNVIPNASPTPCPEGYVGTQPNCIQQASQPGQFTPITVPSATALPTVVGLGGVYGGTILIPAANPAAQVTMQISNAEPSPSSGPTLPPFLVSHRAASVRVAESGTNTPLIYIALTTTGQVVFTSSSTMPGFPGFTFQLPSDSGSGPFSLAWLEGSTWTTVAGPVSPSACTSPLSGNCVTLQPTLPSLTITAQSPVYLLLYTGGVVPSVAPSASPGGLPTSTASAGASPTAPPSGGSSASPTSSASAIPSSSSSSSPLSSPSGGPTLAPTATASASSSPGTFGTPTPTAPPSTSPSGSPPASFNMGTWPSPQPGTALSGQAVTNFQVLSSSGGVIGNSFSQAVTVSSNNSAFKLSYLGGPTPGPSVTLTSGSQAALLALTYSGAATTAVKITASALNATSNSITLTPPIPSIVYSGPTLAGNPEIDLYAPYGQGTGSSFSFSATQAGYTGSFGNNVTITGASNCSTFATISPTAGTSFTVTAINAPAAGSCTITLNAFSTTLSVKITYTSFGVTLQ